MRAGAMLVLAGGCSSADPQPQLMSYGILMPLCIVLCDAVVETVDGGGAAAPVTITRTLTRRGGTSTGGGDDAR